MVAKLQQNSTIKTRIKTNNSIPSSTNLSQCQHCLPVNFNNFIFNSTISSQYQLQQLLNFNIVIRLNINSKRSNQKKVSLLKDKHLLISIFQQPNSCQDQQLKIRVNNSKYSCQQIGSELGCFYRESLGRTKVVAQQDMAVSSDREVT